VPVAAEEIPDTGQRFDLVADGPVRAAVAKVAGLRDLPRFEAHFDVARRGAGGLHVTGKISATVGQTCVITLEPLANEIEETVDLLYEPSSPLTETEDQAEPRQRDVEVDPYPRNPGAIFEAPPEGKPDGGPFAALAPLAKREDGG
jgi:hypothetical protein